MHVIVMLQNVNYININKVVVVLLNKNLVHTGHYLDFPKLRLQGE